MASTPLPSLLVFGPQTPPPSHEQLARLRSLLLGSAHLETFAAAIIDLDSTWSDLVAADPSLDGIPGARQKLQNLRDWVVNGAAVATEPLDATSDGLPADNIVLTPLTVITHVVEYFGYLERNKLSHREVARGAVARRGGYQGFCTGLLAAVALSLTADAEADAVRLAAVALRLALIIGAYVDLDICSSSPPTDVVCLSVRWSKGVEKSQILETLNDFPEAYISVISEATTFTVTVNKKSETSLSRSLSKKGAVVRSIPLHGRFHTQANKDAYTKALSHCRSNARLRFPYKYKLSDTLTKSGSSAQIASESQLHEVVLRSVLLDRSEWDASIRASVADAVDAKVGGPEEKILVVAFGDNDSVPRSLSTEHDLEVFHARTGRLPGGGRTSSSDDYVPPQDAVAVIGMACRFPGADSLEEYWELLQSGSSMLGKLPSERFPTKGLRRTPKDDVPFIGNFLRDGYAFDHKFFGRSSRESASMDPQHKLILQVAYEALESAAYFSNGSSSSSDVGCYVGVAASDYEDNVASHSPTAFSVPGMVRAFIGGKISHFFGLSGPSMVFDTACSSSAVAIHTACKAIQIGDCSMALAGGVNVITSPVLHQNLAAANFLSKTGESKAFDARADGYCRGEGAGLVLLKKYSEAVKDGDRVLGLIVGSSVNQNDNCAPITVPVTQSQSTLFKRALEAGRMDSSRVSYVEAHGTGTPKGDPIECASIREVFGNKASRQLHFGSVKAMIGHTEAASGVAGLIKVLLMMQNRAITPQASFQTLNPSIPPLAPSNMEISRSNKVWDARFLAACVNNYGAAGSNAALLVCENPVSFPKTTATADLTEELAGQYPVTIAAKSVAALHSYCKALQAYIARHSKGNPHQTLADIAYELSRRQRSSMPHALRAKVKTLSELQVHLDAWSSATQPDASPKCEKKPSLPVVLVFSGQSGKTAHMSEELYLKSTLVRTYLDKCDRIVRSMGSDGIIPRIFRQDPVSDIVQFHCMMFALQYTCARSWIDSGLKVTSVVGHSFGQLTSLCVAGAMSLEDGLKIIHTRATMIQEQWGPERGAMLSVDVGVEETNKIIQVANQMDLDVAIACYNAPSNHIVTGSVSSIDALETLIAEQPSLFGKVRTKRIEVTHAFHSRFIDDLMTDYHDLLEQIHFTKPSIPVETPSDGASWGHIGPALVARQFREPVFFSQAIHRLEKKYGPCTWLEAGTGTAAISLARNALQAGSASPSPHSFHQVKLSGSDPIGSLVDTTLSLWDAGVDVQFWPFHNQNKHLYSVLPLPPYQFEKHRNWLEYVDRHAIEPSAPEPAVVSPEDNPSMVSLLRHLDATGRTALFNISQNTKEFQTLIKGHDVLGHPLCPVSLYVEIASRAAFLIATDVSPDAYSPKFEGLKIFSPLGLDQTGETKATLKKIDGTALTWRFTLSSRRGVSSKETRHAIATISLVPTEDPKTRSFFGRFEKLVNYTRTESLFTSPAAAAIQGPPVYKLFDRVVRYSAPYRGVKKISFLEQEVAGQVTLPTGEVDGKQKSICNPLAIDNFTQVAGLHVNGLESCAETDVYICSEFEELHMAKNMNKEDGRTCGTWLVYSSHTSKNDYRDINSDIYVFDSSDKSLVMMVLGVRFTRTNISAMEKALSKANMTQPLVASNTVPRLSSSASPAKQTLSSPITRPVAQISAKPRISPAKPSKPAHSSPQDIKWSMRQLLQEVADVPADEIRDDSHLEEVGVDSLMATELINAIAEKFGVSISANQFADISDFKTLCQMVQPDTEATTTDSFEDSEELEDSASDVEESTTPASVTSMDLPQDDLASRLQKLLSEHLDVSSDMSMDSNLAEIGVDSLSGIELGADIEKEFGVKVDTTGLDPECTVSNILETIASAQSTSVKQRAPIQKMTKQTREVRPEKCEMSVKPNFTITPEKTSLSNAPEDFRSIRSNYLPFAQETGWAGFRTNVYPRQRQLVATYVIEAFESLGCSIANTPAGSELQPVQKILPRHAKVMGQYYKVLQEVSLVKSRNGRLLRTTTPVPNVKSDSLFNEMLSEFPQHASELKLLKSTGSKLAECLTGKTDPLKILFGSKADRDLMEDVYTNSPMFSTGTKILAEYFKKTFASYRGGERLQILELGAGTGGTTKDILAALSSLGIDFTYTFTDLSSSLTAAAKRKFKEYGDSMEYQVLDIEKNPPENLMGRYHAILSSNCVHATKDILHSSTNIRKMLRLDGFVSLLELTRNLFWLDCVFGLLEGWWLFADGREHVLADEHRWQKTLLEAGFQHVDWTDDASEESDQFRVINGFMSPLPSRLAQPEKLITEETIEYHNVDGLSLKADIFYPKHADPAGVTRPIALMIHGGGHIMLSRKDVRPRQTRLLVERGLLPISIDYRLCPEVRLDEGPMADACTALAWARSGLAGTRLARGDVRPDGNRVVVVGWSTGGTLAMSTAFTAPRRGVRPPEAVLAFYCPSDYESDFWRRPNYPERTRAADAARLRARDPTAGLYLLDSVADTPRTEYNVPFERRAKGGWLDPDDARSRIALHMNWNGQALPVLLDGLPSRRRALEEASSLSSSSSSSPSPSISSSGDDGKAAAAVATVTDWADRPIPSAERIAAVSPYRQIVDGAYRTPTFMVHGTADDLVPWRHSARAVAALRKRGVPAAAAIVPDAVHLLDLYSRGGSGWAAVLQGYRFVLARVGL